MAKKSAKKSSGLNIANIIAVALGIVAIIAYGLFPMVKFTTTVPRISETVTLYKGFNMIFGGEVTSSWTLTSLITDNVTTGTGNAEIAFNTGAFIAVLLVALAAILTLAITFVKSFSKNKLLVLIAGVLFVVGGILMFCSKGFAVNAFDAAKLADSFSLAYGAIIAAILALLAGITTIVYPFVKK